MSKSGEMNEKKVLSGTFFFDLTGCSTEQDTALPEKLSVSEIEISLYDFHEAVRN